MEKVWSTDAICESQLLYIRMLLLCNKVYFDALKTAQCHVEKKFEETITYPVTKIFFDIRE